MFHFTNNTIIRYLLHPAPAQVQSWAKSVKNVALSYPQSAYPVDLVPQWPLPLPHPGQSCLVGIRNDPAELQHCFCGGKWKYL